MIIDWKDVKIELPPNDKRTRCLAFCFQHRDLTTLWRGVIDVMYDPHEGWIRCETDKRDVRVYFWAEHPKYPGDPI